MYMYGVIVVCEYIKFTQVLFCHTHAEVWHAAVCVCLQHEATWLPTGNLELLSNRTVQYNPESVLLQLL